MSEQKQAQEMIPGVNDNVIRIAEKLSETLGGENKADSMCALGLLLSFSINDEKFASEQERKAASMTLLALALKIAADAGLSDDEFSRVLIPDSRLN